MRGVDISQWAGLARRDVHTGLSWSSSGFMVGFGIVPVVGDKGQEGSSACPQRGCPCMSVHQHLQGEDHGHRRHQNSADVPLQLGEGFLLQELLRGGDAELAELRGRGAGRAAGTAPSHPGPQTPQCATGWPSTRQQVGRSRRDRSGARGGQWTTDLMSCRSVGRWR